MKYLSSILISALALFFTEHVIAIEFKGVETGASVASVKSKFPKSICLEPGSAKAKILYDNSCSAFKVTIAEIPTALSFYFYENSLWQIRSQGLSSRRHDELKLALTSKYGEPMSEKETPVTNAMGVELVNIVTEWNTQDARITLTKYDRKISESSLKILSIVGMEEMTNRYNEYKKTKASSDL